MICTPNVPTSVARPGVGGKSMHFPSRGQHHTASLGALGLVDPPLTGPQKRLADASGPRAVYSVNEPQPPCGVAPDSGPGLFSSKASAGHQARQAPGSPRLPSPCLRAGDCPGSRIPPNSSPCVEKPDVVRQCTRFPRAIQPHGAEPGAIWDVNWPTTSTMPEPGSGLLSKDMLIRGGTPAPRRVCSGKRP